MQLINAASRSLAVIMLIAIVTIGFPRFNSPLVSSQAPASAWTQSDEPDGFVYYEDAGKAICRPATSGEAESIQQQKVVPEVLYDNVTAQDAGEVNIILRGTPQLETFPLAKAVFFRAVDIWKSKIQTMGVSVTIFLDVDFGPTRFGTPYPSGVLGSTGPQTLLNDQGYSNLRNGLISKASSTQEGSLYASLPATVMPTEIGGTVGSSAPSPLLRALGVIPPVPDLIMESGIYGSPPSIGFNSAFDFDFDPSDGIESNRFDFEAVAVHEMGHVLGFTSRVGAHELNPSATLSVTVLDIFRFRPGTTLATFGSAPRVLASGGMHMFFAGGPELPLSTARQDGTGGDRFQASHWKDSSIFGSTIGIMDPAIARGERSVITDNDLRAYDAFGYQLKQVNSSAPNISSIKASLAGDAVTVTGAVQDGQGDITQAQTGLLDASGGVLVQNAPVAVNLAGQTTANYSLQITGLNNRPTATQVSLVFIDSQGNRSSAGTADFSLSDDGGPRVNKANYDAKLIIKGSDLVGMIQIEINGVIVLTKDNGNEVKLKAGGSATELNLRSGPNRVRVIKGGLRSNAVVTTL